MEPEEAACDQIMSSTVFACFCMVICSESTASHIVQLLLSSLLAFFADVGVVHCPAHCQLTDHSTHKFRPHSRFVTASLVGWVFSTITADLDVSAVQLAVENLLSMLLRLVRHVGVGDSPSESQKPLGLAPVKDLLRTPCSLGPCWRLPLD